MFSELVVATYFFESLFAVFELLLLSDCYFVDSYDCIDETFSELSSTMSDFR